MRLLPLVCTVLLLTGCYDSRFGEPEPAAPTQLKTVTIRKLCDTHTGTTYVATGDIHVRGVVTASDEGGNFYQTFCIEQDGAGLEVMAGIGSLHNDFPVGCRVQIRLTGLAVGRSYGVVQIGRAPATGSGYATDYLGSPAAVNAACIRESETLEAVSATRRTIGELSPALCGTLVRIEGLRYTPEGLSDGTWAGYKRFTDARGAEIYTYVRTYAGFADHEVPVGVCALTGILQQTGTRYSLKLRDENDCVL